MLLLLLLLPWYAPVAAQEANPPPMLRRGGTPGEPPSGTSVVPRTICEGRNIERLEVAGAGRVSPGDILATMKLEPGVPCRDTEVTRDVKALWALGYFEDLAVAATLVDESVVLKVVVTERPAIGEVEFSGNDAVSDEDIEEVVKLREGEILSETQVREQVEAIQALYAEEGFFLARVEYKLDPQPKNAVAVIYEIDEGPEVAVRRVRFIGNHNLDDTELLGFMKTNPTGFLSFMTSSNTFKKADFDEDMLRLQALYYDRGYLSVQVGTPRVELSADYSLIDISIPITEGPRFRVGRLKVAEYEPGGQSVDPLGGRRELRERISLDPGDWFNRTQIAESIERLTRYYRDRGFAKVRVEPRTDLRPTDRKVDITVAVLRGPPVHIERIEIRGNEKTRDKVIRREILIAEGDEYDQSLLEASKARIQALGYFERVDMAETDGQDTDGIVVTFEVAERATGTFQLGAGFSSIEQFILTAQIQQQNLFGHGQSLSLQAQLSGIRQLIELQFVEPYLFGTFWSSAVEAFRTSRGYQDFTQNSTGGGLSLGHPVLNRNLRLSLGYRGEQVTTDTSRSFGFASNAPGALTKQLLPFADQQIDGFTSSLRLSLTWDNRDNRIFPTRGFYTSLSAQFADENLGSENEFQRYRYFGRFYQPVIAGLVLKLNTEGGLIWSQNDKGVPLYERFFMGGIMSVRGFPLQSVGPHVAAPSQLDPVATGRARGVAIGGNAMLRYNLELELPVAESVGIRAVLFTDGGNSWNLEDKWCQAGPAPSRDGAEDPCTGIDPLDLRKSWGVGFRWFSPLGPLRFEWGLPFKPRSYEETYRFEFTIGNFF